MARPTKLTTELLRDTKNYMEMCVQKNRLPTIEGLCVVLGLSKMTVGVWRKPFETTNTDITETEKQELVQMHDEFSYLIQIMMNMQGDQLINKGLDGLYNPTIAKVLLTKHGYREGIETDITTQGEKVNTVLPEIIAEADRLLKIKKLSETTTP